MDKLLYFFSQNFVEGAEAAQSILGGKGANLARMCQLGLPVPPGFTISSALCHKYSANPASLDSEIINQLKDYIVKLEQETGKVFGGLNPLLLSVRSGAEVSMPGMMDTILNLGINDQVVQNIANLSQNPRFAYDAYRRFIEMYASVVLEIPCYHFEEILENCKIDNGYTKDSDISAHDLERIINLYKEIIFKYTGQELETDPFNQLIAAIKSVLKSWNSSRAIAYRTIHNIRHSMGTAVNIQSMVFGNKNDQSATGVIFTRNPISGEKQIFGEYLVNAQGEDVVAGIRTPYLVVSSDKNSMQQIMPKQFLQLQDLSSKLEAYFKDMQDIEFTIEDSKLYLLQTRNGKRSAAASLKILVDMVAENLLTKEEAILKIDTESLNQLLHTTIDYSAQYNVIATGLPASPGAATGIAVFSSSEAEELSFHQKVILVRNDTSPEDIKGMHVSQAIITARGGMTSHAAVVARGLGRPCVCGINNISIDEINRQFITQDGLIIKQGDLITIDGTKGQVILGRAPLITPKISEAFEIILKWCDDIKRLKVRANAETPLDASLALKFGACGIGLARSEHMFFDKEKIFLIHQMIIAPLDLQRQEAIKKLAPMQVKDFSELFKIMNGKPINLRLLDPPLHEFLPSSEEEKIKLANVLDISFAEIEGRIKELAEANPMLGHRGCRLGISTPEIYKMQIEAILDAAYLVQSDAKQMPQLEIMIPLISEVNELLFIKNYLQEIVQLKEQKYSVKFNLKLGTMIELPRAALISNKIAEHVDYFSFGSNDLTQTTYGISRDDIGSFLPDYLSNNIFQYDPFIVLDQEGVGELIKISVDKSRKVKDITFGVCGEHAGNPASIDFFEAIKLDYISCSPYRIPIARVAAAQSYIKLKGNK
ncbi:MAG: pyruvate, phosphate dikinase [Rickettsiaceae bacterium]|nr:pyruvate, phosphate dikinase [Rickettsiaceae bacterium]